MVDTAAMNMVDSDSDILDLIHVGSEPNKVEIVSVGYLNSTLKLIDQQ